MTTTLLDRAISLHNLGHLPVLGHMHINSTTGKKSMSFTPGFPYASPDAYLKNLHKHYSSRYNIVAIYIDKTTLIKCIDIDLSDDADSMMEVNEIMQMAMKLNMPIDKTPSGGYHIFYRSNGTVFDDVEKKINGLSTMGIDLLEKGHLCIVEGEGYKKMNYATLDATTVPEIDESFRSYIVSLINEYKTAISDTATSISMSTSSVMTARSTDIQIVKDLVNSIDLYEPPAIDGYGSFNDYDIYIKILTAIYNSTGGSAEGLKVAKKFSQRVADRYGEDLDSYINETHTKWNYGWKTGCDNPLTIATLYKLARRSPPLSTVINTIDYRAYISDKDVDQWMLYTDYATKWEDRQIEDANEFYEFAYDTQIAVKYITSMDSYAWKMYDGSLMFTHPGKFSVTMTFERKPKRYIFRNGRDNDIYHMFTGYFKKYERVEFFPGHRTTKSLNTWTGFKAKLLPDDLYNPNIVEPFIYHVRQVMCSGNEEQTTWVLDWLASLIQTPEKKYGVALVLYSNTQGTGKTTLIKFLINAIIGETHSTSCNGLNPLFEDHNTICENRILLNVEEAFTARDKYASFKNQFKDVITGDTMSINPKGQTRYTAKNYTKFCITTNHIDSIPIDETDRRFTFIEVSNKHKEDQEYFKMLYSHFDDPSFADQVFTYLSKRVITSNLYTPLATEAKHRSIAVNADSLTQFTDHIIQSDYRYEYTTINGINNVLDFKHYRIEQTIFLEAYKHYTNLHDLRRVPIRKKRIDGTLPNNLAIIRPRKQNKELVYFKNIDYDDD